VELIVEKKDKKRGKVALWKQETIQLGAGHLQLGVQDVEKIKVRQNAKK